MTKIRGDVSAQDPPNSRRVRGGGGSLPALGSRARVSVSALARQPRARASRARDTTPARIRAPSKPSRSPPARPRSQRVPSSPLPPLGPRRGRARDGDDVIAPGSAALPRPAGTFEGDARPAPGRTRARRTPSHRHAPFASNIKKKRHIDAPSRRKLFLALTPPHPPRARSRDRRTTASPHPRTTGSSTASLISAPARNPTTS